MAAGTSTLSVPVSCTGAEMKVLDVTGVPWRQALTH